MKKKTILVFKAQPVVGVLKRIIHTLWSRVVKCWRFYSIPRHIFGSHDATNIKR